MTAARELREDVMVGRGSSRDRAAAIHLRGHASDLAANAETYATQLELTVEELERALFGPRPRDTEAAPNVKPIPAQSLVDELIRLDNATGRIGTAAKRLAEIRERVQPSEGPTAAPYPDAEPPRVRGERYA